MQLRLFILPVKHSAAVETNQFLRLHRVLAVRKEFLPHQPRKTS